MLECPDALLGSTLVKILTLHGVEQRQDTAFYAPNHV
jgi:hypothetical protein